MMNLLRALLKAQVKGFYRTDKKTGKRVWVKPHDTRRQRRMEAPPKGRERRAGAPEKKGKPTGFADLPKRARDFTPEQEERLISHIATWDKKKIYHDWEVARAQIKTAMDKGDKGAAEDLRIKANIYGLAIERKAKGKGGKPVKPKGEKPSEKEVKKAHRLTLRKGVVARLREKPLEARLNTPARVQAAIASFSRNRGRYTPAEQVPIWRRLIKAAGRFNLKISDELHTQAKRKKKKGGKKEAAKHAEQLKGVGYLYGGGQDK